MMHLKPIHLLFLCVSFPRSMELNITEAPTEIHHCLFQYVYLDINVKCTNLDDKDLESNTGLLSSIIKNYNFFPEEYIATYIIEESTISNIINGSFEELFGVDVFQLKNSKVKYFDLFGGFHGLQDSLQDIRIENVSVSNWVFSSGTEFNELKKIEITMPYGNEWVVDPLIPCFPGSLSHIYLKNFVVNASENFTFERFTGLVSLSLIQDGLTFVNRTYLPQPAKSLKTYQLSYNPISFLPEDMFMDMPKLKKVSLQGTDLRTLHYHIFQPVFDQLTLLQIADIKLNCDCDTAWLLMKKKIWNKNLGEKCQITCYHPNSSESQNLALLMPIDMCYDCKESQLNSQFYNGSSTVNYATDKNNNSKAPDYDDSTYAIASINNVTETPTFSTINAVTNISEI